MMGELHRALGDIRSIRRQVALRTEFRGYGPVTLLVTSGIAVAAGFVQAWFVPVPVAHPVEYVAVWAGAAAVSLLVIGVSTLTRTRRMHSGLENEMIRMAAEQFLPALVAGVLLTAVLVWAAPSAVWMLAGLWQIVYSLGIFSSCRFLPRPMAAAGVWFLAMGLMCIAMTDARALRPWHMALAFGFGQALIAAVLYLFAEAVDEEGE